jgi:hypothetical protein
MGARDPRVVEMVHLAAANRSELFPSAVAGYKNDRDLRVVLAKSCSPAPTPVRAAVIAELASTASGSSEAHELLGRFSFEEDLEVRALAACNLATALVTSSDSMSELVSRLLADATCYGPRIEVFQSSAFCALLLLKQLHLLTERLEDSECALLVRVDTSHRGTVVSKYIADQWAYITEAWGENAWQRFRHASSSELDFWAAHAEWLQPESDAGRHVLRLIQQHQQPVSHHFLDLLLADGGTPPALLLDNVLRLLGIRGEGAVREVAVQSKCADVIARRFASNEVLEEFKAHEKKSGVSSSLLITASRAWPDDPWTDSLYREVDEKNLSSSALAIIELMCARADASLLCSLLERLVLEPELNAPRTGPSAVRAFVRRARRDATFSARLANMLADSIDISVRISIVRVLLLTSPEHARDAVDTFGRMLTPSDENVLSPSVFDILRSEARSLQSVVWELRSSLI